MKSSEADQAKSAPVSLESGACYDAGKLNKALDKAAAGDLEKRDDAVQKALETARDDDAGVTQTNAPNALPNHHVVKAEVELVPGTEVGEGKDKKTIGGVTVTEFRQVPDGADEDADGDVLAAAGGQAIIGGTSTVLSTERLDGPDEVAEAVATVQEEAAPPPAPAVDSGSGNK